MKYLCAMISATVALTSSAGWGESPVRLQVYPREIRLNGTLDCQSIVVQVTDETGLTRDVTEQSALRIESEEPVATLDKATDDFILKPKADGKAKLIAEFDGQEAIASIDVFDAQTTSAVSFRRDVMPIFMATGCNAGRCHGSARGQDGFHLSLFGYDAAGDHFRLTREISGRRINVARPEASLLLTKATGVASHTGGERFDRDSFSYHTILQWIEQGAKDDAESPHPVEISIYPPSATITGSGNIQRLVVEARYSDGTTRDVTDRSLYLSNNDNTAKVDSAGLVTTGKRGEAFVMARFDSLTEGVPIIVLSGDEEQPYSEPPAFNDIDRLVYQKLKKLRMSPTGICDDEQFLRRVTIDLTGLTPTREQYERFMANPSKNKRVELVDELLNSDSFVELWTMRFGELLQIRTSNQVSYKALLGFHNWVRNQIANGEAIDQLLADVLSSSGGTFDTPQTNFYQIEANTLQLTENVAQSYMGMRIGCARCHNHPFDRWTMDDYYGFTSFFSQVGFKQSPDPREFIVYDRGVGEITHFIPEREVVPQFLGSTDEVDHSVDRRKALAKWIVSDDNPAFARNIANIIWAHHFGRGIVDPVDDVRISNPPINEELLAFLAEQLVASDYDLRAAVRMICQSRTYQLSTRASQEVDGSIENFARAKIRRLRAESLLDSISQITETTDFFPRLPAGARATQIADGATSNYFLTTFGRAPRETVCACEVDVEPNLSQALQLINGDTVNQKIVEGAVVKHLLDSGKTPTQVVEHLYLLCYGRRPSGDELAKVLATVSVSNPRTDLEDVLWALLNSKEFLFNH